jgi:hypothetical protein
VPERGGPAAGGVVLITVFVGLVRLTERHVLARIVGRTDETDEEVGGDGG